MRPLSASAPLASDVALLVLRLVVGGVMVAHGAQKLFAQGIDATVAGFAGMGVPMPEIAAPFVIGVELVGGALIVLGAALPIVGLLVAIDMAVALALVHAPFGVFVAEGGWELVAALGAGALALAVVGGGRIGVDGLLGGRSRRGRGRA
ncbi:hypothetical protein GCM10009846_25080 [Agrococcus versicolor]|uniref:DoxX family protein n=1 Tax=Agrococcus versicolor TaxID=501482 RepID=A0ABN3AWR2_9MICO